MEQSFLHRYCYIIPYIDNATLRFSAAYHPLATVSAYLYSDITYTHIYIYTYIFILFDPEVREDFKDIGEMYRK